MTNLPLACGYHTPCVTVNLAELVSARGFYEVGAENPRPCGGGVFT